MIVRKSHLVILLLIQEVAAFSPARPMMQRSLPHRTTVGGRQTTPPSTPQPRLPNTSLHSLVDVPYGFFGVFLPTLGIILSISRHISRTRLEERAWEQRLEAAQREMLESNTVATTELDLRRQTAALEWSAYGNNSNNERNGGSSKSSKSTTTTIEPPYDPYYDEPYPEEELPEDRPYSVDRVYGDRVYEDGEIFYKDADSGMFYRQGCKPRGVRFFR